LVASQDFFHIHRSAKRCLEIIDELFGRDRRFAGQLLEPAGHGGSTARERQHYAFG
jgi:hypothetical protein